MLRVPLDLCRTKFIALHQQRNRSRGERHRGSEKFGDARNQFFGLLDVRNDWLVWLASAGSHACERHRSAHHLKEVASGNAIALIFNGTGGEFTSLKTP